MENKINNAVHPSYESTNNQDMDYLFDGGHYTDGEGIHGRVKRSYRHLIVGPIVFLYLFSYIAAFTNTSQYGYYFVGLALFPNGTGSFGINVTDDPCTRNISSRGYKNYLKIQETTSEMNIYFTLATGLPAILLNILYGAYSDKFGRKFLFIVPTVGSFVKTVICVLGIYYRINIYLFLIAFIIEGFTGSFLSMLQVSYAYVSDITTRDSSRSLGITVIEIAVGLGSVLGSLVAGFIIEGYLAPYGYMWCMVLSAGLLVLNVFLVIFVLPETVDTERKGSKNIIHFIRNVFSFYVEPNTEGNRWKYNVCMLVFITVTITVLGRPAVEMLLQLGRPFCWTPKKISYYGTIRSGAQQVVGMGLIKFFQVCMNDHGIAILGSISAVASFIMEAFAWSVGTDFYFYIVPVVGAGGVLTMPMIRAIMSKMTPADKQGAMFGGIAAMETTGGMVSGIITNAIYSQTVEFFQGFVFLVMALFSFVSLVLLMTSRPINSSGHLMTRKAKKEGETRKEIRRKGCWFLFLCVLLENRRTLIQRQGIFNSPSSRKGHGSACFKLHCNETNLFR